MNAFYRHMFDLIESIEACLKKGRVLPCLTLLYSGIDVVASLDTDGVATRKGFLNWVDNYLLKALPIDCTAFDLYAARCAVVHTFTPESDLSKAGRARKIVYAWGNGDLSKLKKASVIIDHNDTAHVHLTDLVTAFRNGIAAYLEEIETQPERQQSVETAARLWYVPLDTVHVDKLLQSYEHSKG